MNKTPKIRKVYYLSTCDTCTRILNELKFPKDFIFQDVKYSPISEEDLEFLKMEVGSYEQLLNKRSKLYKEQNFKEQNLTDEQCKNLILEHYTFLKRPIVIFDNRIIMGNATKIIKDVRKFL